MFRALAPVVSLILLLSSASGMSARFLGKSVVIKDGRKRIRLPEVVEEYAFYATVHSISRRGSDYYLVIGTSVWSRGWPPRGGKCGCGFESSIEWLHIHNGNILESQGSLYESCMRNRFASSIEWKAGKLLWRCEATEGVVSNSPLVVTERKYDWAFDPSMPEKGIEEHLKEYQETVLLH